MKLKDGDKLAPLYRSFSIELPTEAKRGIDEDARTVEVAFSSEEPVERWFGTEILDHSPGACDLSRLNGGGAVLVNHEVNDQVGVVESARIDADRRGRALLRFGNSARADEIFKDVVAGIRRLVSVGYQINQVVHEGDAESEDYRVTRWEPFEISIVPVPADYKAAGVGRSQDNQDSKPISMITKTRKFHEADNGANATSGSTSTAPAITEAERAKATKEAREAEKLRVRELQAFGEKFKRHVADAPQLAQEAIDKDMSVADFRALIMDKIGSEVKSTEQPSEVRNAPHIITSRTRQKSIGQLFTESEGYKRALKSNGRHEQSVEIPDRAGFRATFTTSGLTQREEIPGIVGIEQQGLTIADLIAPGVTNSSSVRYMREVSYTNAATTVAEGGTKPQASFSLEQVTAQVTKIADHAKVTDEMFADYAQVQSFIEERLVFMVQEREEEQLLNGNGSGSNLTGLLNTSGIQTQAVGSDTKPDAIFKALTKIHAVGHFKPSGLVVHPTDWQTLRLTKDANNQYYGGGPFTGAYGNGGMPGDVFWGLPVVITTAIAQGTALAGAFRLGAQIFRRMGITVESTNSDQDDFIKNLITIRAEERLALAVYRPLAFCQITGL